MRAHLITRCGHTTVQRLTTPAALICRAPAVFTEFVGEFVANGTVSFKEVVAAVLDAGERPEKEEGDEEEPDMPLVDVGEAGPIVMKLLAAIKVGAVGFWWWVWGKAGKVKCNDAAYQC